MWSNERSQPTSCPLHLRKMTYILQLIGCIPHPRGKSGLKHRTAKQVLKENACKRGGSLGKALINKVAKIIQLNGNDKRWICTKLTPWQTNVIYSVILLRTHQFTLCSKKPQWALKKGKIVAVPKWLSTRLCGSGGIAPQFLTSSINGG
jgi:hypothetical protein